MPIYHKTPPSIAGNHTTSEIDNHTSEAAKVKRTREHAYFNSYDFDAIEVLPYDDDDEDEEGGKPYNNISTAAINSQKQLKSKTHNSQTRPNQHLTETPKYAHPCKAQPQHPLAVFKHPNVSLANHSLSVSGNVKAANNSSNSDNFIVDQRGGGRHGSHNQKHHSYLQRFGVALFGGVHNKSPSSHHQSASSSSTASTSSSLAAAANGDNKHSKVIISSELSSSSSASSASSSPTTRATGKSCHSSTSPTSSLTTDDVVAGENLKIVVVGSGGGSGVVAGHRDAASKCGLDNNVVSVVNEITNGLTAVTTATSSSAAATSCAVAVGSSTAAVSLVAGSAAAVAAADGNFLLPRAMLKYQSTPIGNSNHLATTNSMPMATATNNSVAATITTLAAGSSSPLTSNNSSCNKIATTVDGFSTQSTAVLKATNQSSNIDCRLKKHSTASSSLSSLGSEEIVEIHHQHHHADVDSEGPKIRKDNKVLPKRMSGKTPGRAASHQSHYSTDKSASSGYYSSNVCSTYSLEEHIYSEPTIEVKEKPLSSHKESLNVVGGGKSNNIASVSSKTTSNINNSNNKPVEDTLAHASTLTLAAGETCSGSVMRTLDYNRRYRYTDHNDEIVAAPQQKITLPAKRTSKEFNENLRILESSIENLDRHLKTFPGVISTQDAIVAYAQNPYHSEKMRSYAHLPTIREGYDATAKRVWPEDPVTDDSLQDIDLDSFLLNDNKKPKHGTRNPPLKGIDNPSFLSKELEDNHYKCAKYINSCPEDAYRVESDIIAPTRSSISEQSVAVSVDSYPKRYEDQIHFQNTRELLEDVRDKIRLLTLSQDPVQELAVSHQAEQQPVLEEYIPKELNTMISTLKRELELYLQRMNQHSELEIRQLCTGLVKNQHIVKMQNAFERRRSLTDSSTDLMSSYENALPGEKRNMGGLPISIRQEITTIKCSSDPNFKMKRKSLAEVFPMSECYIETLALGADHNPPLPPLPNGGLGSQLQRNLNFHQPSIQQFESKTDNFEKSTDDSSGGRARGTASGHDSSESNDKDSILDWHRKKPSIWEMYYGTNRIQQSLLGGNSKKNGKMITTTTSTPSPMCYPSSRPESDFTLDLPRAEQLRIKMEKEKKFRQRCRVITTFLSLVFFLLTVMVVSLVLTRGKRMFGSMI